MTEWRLTTRSARQRPTHYTGRGTKGLIARLRASWFFADRVVSNWHMALTIHEQFDSYRTMYVARGGRGKLAPGQFDRIAKALSDPRRFALLETIAAALECPVEKLCRDFPISKATVSHHLRELVQAGLVESERDGQYKHCRVRRDVLNAYAAELMKRVGTKRSTLS